MSPSRIEGSPTQTIDVPPGLQLIPEEELDLRTDKDIIQELLTKRPVTSEKNIWSYWHSGFNSMPPWLRRNVISWSRRHAPEWTIHVLDDVPGSETNVRSYVESEYLPEAFNNDTLDGPYKATHSSDLIRLPLLLKYGGVWMDMGTILFRHIDDICWRAIEDPGSTYDVAVLVIAGTTLNGFIACKKDNIFLKHWHNTYLKLWEGGITNAKGFHQHPIFDGIKPRDTQGAQLSGSDFTDYLAHSQCVLAVIKNANAGFNGSDYYCNNLYIMDAAEEMYLLQFLTQWDGKTAFDLLSAKRTGAGVAQDENWKRSEEVVQKLLANSSMIKLSHGPKGLFPTTLAGFWDSEEYADADVEPGTFAAYLREASVKYDQSRKIAALSSDTILNRIVKQQYIPGLPAEEKNEA